jgi:hypothetical protein
METLQGTEQPTVEFQDNIYDLERIAQTYREELEKLDREIQLKVDSKLTDGQLHTALSRSAVLTSQVTSALRSDTSFRDGVRTTVLEAVMNDSRTKEALAREAASYVERAEDNRFSTQVTRSLDHVKQAAIAAIHEDLRIRAAEAMGLQTTLKGLLSTLFKDEIAAYQQDIFARVQGDAAAQTAVLRSQLTTAHQQLWHIQKALRGVTENELLARVGIQVPWPTSAAWGDLTPAQQSWACQLEDYLNRNCRLLGNHQRRISSQTSPHNIGVWKIDGIPNFTERPMGQQLYVNTGLRGLLIPLWDAVRATQQGTVIQSYHFVNTRSPAKAHCNAHPDARFDPMLFYILQAQSPFHYNAQWALHGFTKYGYKNLADQQISIDTIRSDWYEHLSSLKEEHGVEYDATVGEAMAWMYDRYNDPADRLMQLEGIAAANRTAAEAAAEESAASAVEYPRFYQEEETPAALVGAVEETEY